MKTREEIAAAVLFWAAVAVSLHHLDQDETRSALLSVTASIAAGLLWLHVRGVTRMSKPNKKRFKLDTLRANAAEKRGGASIEIEAGDGQVFSFPTPAFWSDEQLAVSTERDVVKLATVLLGGEDEYAKFRAAGGQASDIALAMSEFSEAQGATAGESPASSAS